MSNLPSLIISCYRSGVPLASVTTLCSQGWPLLNSFQSSLLHPIYKVPLTKLVVKLKNHLIDADATAWSLTDHELTEIKLCLSAVMYDLDAIWQASPESQQHIPSLPSTPVAIGSASRLLALAEWYHFATTKRLKFPQYRIAHYNNNLEWENFSAWLDDAESIIDEWRTGRVKLERDEELRKREAAIATVRAENIYKRIDFNKVWNWIDIQLAVSVAASRRETFKELFMRGDLAPEDWLADDVDDLKEAILQNCDIGNEITFFINTRLKHIRQLIHEFYSSFTLLDGTTGMDTHPDKLQTEQEQQFFAQLDEQAANFEELPPAPVRTNFASNALFLKAQAQHRLVAKRFAMAAKRQEGENHATI